MKILYPSHARMPKESAVSVQITGMCQAFRKLDHEVLLYARKGDLEVSFDEYYDLLECFEHILHNREVSPLPGTMQFYTELVSDVYGEYQPDLIYSRHLKSLLALAFSGKPLVYERHWRIAGLAEKWMLKVLFSLPNFKRLIVTTGVLRDIFLDQFPSLEGDVVVAHMAEHKEVVNSDYNSTDHRLPGGGSQFKAGYVGGLNPSVEIMIKLAERCDWADFHVFGGDEQWKIDFWENRGNHLDNFYMHGFVEPSELKQYTAQLDAGLAPYCLREVVRGDKGPSIQEINPKLEPEYSSVKVIEYMAMGKAVICSDYRTFSEVLNDGENGLLCSPDDISEWVEALEKLHDNPSFKQTVESRARETFLNNYTWKTRAERCLDGLDLGIS